MSCCDLFAQSHFGHNSWCYTFDPMKVNHRLPSKPFVEGMGTVVFHRLDGKTVRLERVMFDSISPVATNDLDLSGDFENGNPFHVPFVAWWEVVYD